MVIVPPLATPWCGGTEGDVTRVYDSLGAVPRDDVGVALQALAPAHRVTVRPLGPQDVEGVWRGEG